ncbi:MAG TPA: hypothetical protein VD926_05175, partial [Acidimicrobiales bacterium]|nr:hypothetical protein [Acidimicrobiales bacterium]
VRRILVDPTLETSLGPPPEGVEVAVAGSPLDLAGCEAREVLVVTANPALLAAAGELGAQRLVTGDDPASVTAAVDELVAFLDR